MSLSSRPKLAIVGSRKFNNKELFTKYINNWIEKNGIPDLIISGGARGADTMAEQYAKKHNIPMKIFRPEYDKSLSYDPAAPLRRNTKIAEACTHVLAFIKGESRGTRDTIKKAENMKKDVTVVNQDQI